MKLIIRQYLASLKERGELDVVLPDLLSQLGLNVYSRPARGTRQDGVDVGAIGSLDGGEDKVFLFSIKPGDLTRRGWDGDSEQSLRPSLNEIIDAYIPNRLPAEHRNKQIVICITIGGDVQEQVRPLLTGHIAKNSDSKISFEEWNGDKLASLIQASFLREDLLPENARSLLRKSLALLDEPEVSYRHFTALIRALSNIEKLTEEKRVTALRQMSICLWIMFGWSREAKNLEAAYLASEYTLLHGWNVMRHYLAKNNKTRNAIESAFESMFAAHMQIATEFLETNILPYADKAHAISVEIRGSCSLDVNLKLFDLLGRIGLAGLWACWHSRILGIDEDRKRFWLDLSSTCADATKKLINNNPALLLPACEEQATDIQITVLHLWLNGPNEPYVLSWIDEIFNRTKFAYITNGKYPCTLRAYGDLLNHPKRDEPGYRENVTNASILLPTIAVLSALFGSKQIFAKIAEFKKEELEHCTFQFWYPDDQSEEVFYTNADHHGATLVEVGVGETMEDLLAQVFGECDHSDGYRKLSAIQSGWWPLIAIACRHYRLPLPLHFLEGAYKVAQGAETVDVKS